MLPLQKKECPLRNCSQVSSELKRNAWAKIVTPAHLAFCVTSHSWQEGIARKNGPSLPSLGDSSRVVNGTVKTAKYKSLYFLGGLRLETNVITNSDSHAFKYLGLLQHAEWQNIQQFVSLEAPVIAQKHLFAADNCAALAPQAVTVFMVWTVLPTTTPERLLWMAASMKCYSFWITRDN